MYLRFIGTNGSMGLKHGRVYNVNVMTRDNYIWVLIPKFKLSLGVWKCPYSSPQSFANNWSIR